MKEGSAKEKKCVKRESNPQLNLGRVSCYHYTIDAAVGSSPSRGGI
jgi:hypothetical protein